MSQGPNNKSREMRQRLERLKTQLVLPDERDPRQLWIMVRMDPMDGQPGCFFVAHAKSFTRYEALKGFTVMAHSYDRPALTIACRKATIEGGPAYQPKNSAHAGEKDYAATRPSILTSKTPEAPASSEPVGPAGIVKPTDIL